MRIYKVKKIKNKQDIRGIYHFSAKESMTKYQMCGKVQMF
jgi:S-adenosylmethionine synthetase